MKRTFAIACALSAVITSACASAGGITEPTVRAIVDRSVSSALAGVPTPVPTPTAFVFPPTPTALVFPPTPTPFVLPPTPTAIALPATPTAIVFGPTPTAVTFPPTPTAITFPTAGPTAAPTITPTPTPFIWPTPMSVLPYSARGKGKVNSSTFQILKTPFRLDWYSEGMIGPIRVKLGNPLSGEVGQTLVDGLTATTVNTTFVHGMVGTYFLEIDGANVPGFWVVTVYEQ